MDERFKWFMSRMVAWNLIGFALFGFVLLALRLNELLADALAILGIVAFIVGHVYGWTYIVTTGITDLRPLARRVARWGRTL